MSTTERATIVVPPHRRQLGTPVSGTTDCAVRAAQMSLGHATYLQIDPGPQIMRQKMGVEPSGGTTLWEAIRGLRAYGIDPVRTNGGRWRDTALKWLDDGMLVVLYGKYGVVIDRWRPLAGSKTYRKGHAIPFYGNSGGKSLSLDPLYDGRRANIPKGPTLVPIELPHAFTGSLVGEGRVQGYAVKPQELPAPTREQLEAAQMAALEAQAKLTTAEQALAAAQQQVAVLQQQLDECNAEPSDCSECEQQLATAQQRVAELEAAIDAVDSTVDAVQEGQP